MRIKIVIGDWSQDGHNEYDEFYIDSNISAQEMRQYYDKASKRLGFDLIKDCCSDYQDNKLPDDVFDKVKKEFGWQKQILTQDDFLDLYLLIIESETLNFKWRIIEEDNNMTLRIGGYGLYDVY